MDANLELLVKLLYFTKLSVDIRQKNIQRSNTMAHKCKELDNLLADIVKQGFRVEYVGSISFRIYPQDKTKAPYFGHMGERGFHPVRRYLKNNFGIGTQ